MRRSGRTTKLILKSIQEFLENGESVFIDHLHDDGNTGNIYPYKSHGHTIYELLAFLNVKDFRVDVKNDRVLIRRI